MKISDTVAKKAKKIFQMDFIVLFPIIFCIAVLPLIVRYAKVPMSIQTRVFWDWRSKYNSDFFSYYKMIFFLGFTSFSIIIFLLKLLEYKKENKSLIKKTHLYIPLGIFTYFVVISTIISQHKDVAMFGFPDRYEGAFVVIAYLIMMLFSTTFVNTEKHLKIVFISLFISALIFSALGLLQYFGHDILLSKIGRHILLSAKDIKLQIKSSSTKGTIVSTIYNSNYVGSYMDLIFPVSLVVFLMPRNVVKRILSGVMCLVFFAVLIGCNSRAGYMGCAVEAVIILIIFRKQIKENLKAVIPLVLGFILVFNFMSYMGTNSVGRLKDSLKTSSLLQCKLQDVKMSDSKITLKCEQETFYIKRMNKKSISFFDTHDRKLKAILKVYKKGKNIDVIKVNFKEKLYTKYIVYYYAAKQNIRIKKQDLDVRFAITNRGFRIVDNYYRPQTIPKIKTFGFKGKETWGTNRGYIWSRSLPLLKDTIIAGHGPDTYAFYFPQDDYVGKLVNYGNLYILVDKPHNYYIGLGINDGIVSMISMLIFFIMYFIWSIKLYINHKFSSLFDYAGGAIFLAFCGYGVSLLFNDSVVSVAPVFWILIGIGISINLNLQGKTEKSITA